MKARPSNKLGAARKGPSTNTARAGDRTQNEAAVIARAMGVIGNKLEAPRWLGTSVRELDYATPISLLRDREGVNAVMTVLTRIEHGVL